MAGFRAILSGSAAAVVGHLGFIAAAHDAAGFGERGRSEGGFLRGHSRSGRPRQPNAISIVMPVGRKSSTKE